MNTFIQTEPDETVTERRGAAHTPIAPSHLSRLFLLLLLLLPSLLMAQELPALHKNESGSTGIREENRETDIPVDSLHSSEPPAAERKEQPQEGRVYPDQPEGARFRPVGKGTTTVIPGKEYDRGGLHRLIYGGLWRDLWGTEIEVPYLDLERTEGGLTPVKVGGGRQTTSLRLKGANGREYKFRSVNKEFSSVLPNALQETFVDNVLQDMISAQHPVGALVAAPLHDAVGVLNATPNLNVRPDDPRLGEYPEEFAGMLGMIEEHPNEGADDNPGFLGYTKIVGDKKIYDKLLEDNHNHIDHIDYLKVRLVDMLIGDWSRHIDQYRWAGEEEGEENYWRPIPRDRDMAFARYNGILPWLAAEGVPEIEGTGEDYPDIENLTWTGKTLDRRFLVPISREAWDSTTAFVLSRLTDQVIDEAVHRMPKEMYEQAGEELAGILRSRRDELPEASEEFFELIHEQSDLWGSDDNEYVEIYRLNDDRVRVAFYRRDQKTGEKDGSPYLDHTFDRSQTDEIRISLLGGDDKTVVMGEVNSSITVKIDGGEGTDEFVDDSKVNGYFWFTPIPDAETSTYFIDSDDDSRFALGPGTRLDRHEHPAWREDSVAYAPYYRDFGSDWSWAPWLGYSSSDDGLSLGIRPKITGYGFRQEPYAWEQSLGVAYAFGTQGIKVEYNGDFRTFVPNARVLINAEATELTLSNFFGFGNETDYSVPLDDAGFYDIGQEQYSLITDLQVPQISDFRLYFGARASHTRTNLERSPLLDSLRPYGVDPTTLAALRTGMVFDSRNYTRIPTRGFYITAEGEFFPHILDNRSQFATGRIDARTYLSAYLLRPVTLALRALGQKVIGDEYPYFEAAYLGGSRSLRGYEGERFAGDMTLSGSAELRLSLFNYKLIARSTFGLLGFIDAGRAYLDGETSDTWHYGYGGGIFLAFGTNRLVTLSTARSAEGNTSLYAGLGHRF